MNHVLAQLEPNLVFGYFEDISMIPRGSGNEKAISDYLVDFARKNNLEVIQDKAMNVIIKKPGTPGYENAPAVIIQGHMDMVCDKNQDTVHDFEKDPIKLRIVDDMIYATGTTLGADNGIAVAYGMALLTSKDIAHPPLEILITVEEETGLNGAASVDASQLKGKYLINIDSEEEGVLLVSCAGGVRTIQSLPAVWETPKEGYTGYVIELRGLNGGHSGMDIGKGGNANKIMGRILNSLSSTVDFQLCAVNGGSKMNAIPRECNAVILLEAAKLPQIERKIAELDSTFKNELSASDAGIFVRIRKCDEKIHCAFSAETTRKVIASLVMIPNGVQTMSMHIKGLVESSTNLGVTETREDVIRFESAVRSSVRSLKYSILDQAKMVAATVGAALEAVSDYPEWEYNPDSKLRNLFESVYSEKYGKKPETMAIHAGLECGLFKEKMPHLDMISLGPDTFNVHTPDEHVSIPSVQRTWDYLLAVLKEMK